ncbi:FkbM family methyltransferase, partial [Candidatus Pacearchaeota archaeon]|nr:FkbM family methyltransferase [Candidatus Pacearchaeota archaeon]
MNIYDSSIKIVEDYLDNHDTVTNVIEKIKAGAGKGNIAFFPCSRYANIVVNDIKDKEPELFKQIEGIYDGSREAKSDTGIPVAHVSDIAAKKDDLSLVVICSNTYHDREFSVLARESGYKGDVIRTSYFDISLPEQSKAEILADIKTVYDMLADEKSKAVYMMTWLSKALNDETYTYLFESEEHIEIDGQDTKYKGYSIKGLGDVCAAELFAEIYQMRHVFPEKGDTVLDIGGYKGDSAIFFADAVGDDGNVFVFEPTSSNFRDLNNNVKNNNLNNIIVPVNKGVSDKSGSMMATSVDSGAPWSFISEEQGNEEVAVITIDDF